MKSLLTIIIFSASTALLFGQAPTPVIEVIGYPGANPTITAEAPFTLHAHALASDLHGKTDVKTLYEWNYGDAGSESDFNSLEGWTGSHLYRGPGVYTVTLRITDEDNLTGETSITVTVTESTRQEVYLSSTMGNDAHDGLTPQTAKESLEAAMALVSDHTVLNILRGDTINTLPYQMMLTDLTDVVIRPYGPGNARPVLSTEGLLEASDSNPPHITISNCSKVVIQDLLLTSEIAPEYHVPFSTPWNGIFCNDPSSSEVTIADCAFEHIGFSIATWNLTGLLILNNHAGMVGKYLHYGAASHATSIGNICVGTTDGLCIRAYQGPWNISHNTLWTDFEELIAQEPLGGLGLGTSFPIALVEGTHYYVARNVTHGPWTVGYWADNVTTVHNCVLDGNITYRHSHYDPTLRIFHESDNLMIRNNVFYLNDDDINTEAIRFEQPGSGYPDEPPGVVGTTWVYNNTFISGSDMATFINIGANPLEQDTFHIANNLAIFPDLEGGHSFGWDPFMITATDALGNVVFSHNLWQEPVAGQAFRVNGGYIAPNDWGATAATDSFHLYVAADVDFMLANDFALNTNDPSIGFCQPLPGVHRDMQGNTRPTAAQTTAGAVEMQPDMVVSVDRGNVAARSFQVFPNPTSSLLFIRNNSFATQSVSVYAMDGSRHISERPVSQGQGLDVSLLPAGMYLLELRDSDNGSVAVTKFIRE